MVESPCLEICTMDPRNAYCTGCYRSLDEIANWSDYSDDQKERVIHMLQKRKENSAQTGFTLLEIAIVIAIIGLLVGGITVGREYIRDAAIRAQMTQMDAIQAAIQQFETKYQCFPGDCSDPTIISNYTYSGNGNGYLSSTWNDDENKGFWLHLSNSGILEDRLTAHDNALMSGMRTPRMRLNDAGFINALGNLTTAQNVLIFATATVSGALAPVEIITIDEKMDDGIAASGMIRTTGFGSGATTVYAGTAFPLAVTNDSGSTHCIASGVYSGAASRCNMVMILAR